MAFHFANWTAVELLSSWISDSPIVLDGRAPVLSTVTLPLSFVCCVLINAREVSRIMSGLGHGIVLDEEAEEPCGIGGAKG